MTVERKIRIEEDQARFMESYSRYGFKNPDEMVYRALELLKQELNFSQELELSADLYAELYDSDEEAKEWTEASTQDWD